MELAKLQNNLLKFLPNYTIDNTGQFHYTRPLEERIVTLFFIILCTVAGIIGNGAVIVASFSSETLKNQAGNLLIVNLSFIDLSTMILVAIPASIAVALNHWPFGDTACIMHATVVVSVYPASALTLAWIALDRLIALSFPLQYTTWVTKKVVYAVCATNTLIWLLLAYFGVRNKMHLINYMNEEMLCFVDYASGDSDARMDLVVLVTVGFFIPGIIITVCYTTVVILVRRSRNVVLPISNGMNHRDLHVIQTMRSMRKATRSMIIVAANFYVMNIPCVAIMSYKHVFGFKSTVPPLLSVGSNLLLAYTTVVNPLIYGIFRKDFREAFKKIFGKVLKAFYGYRF